MGYLDNSSITVDAILTKKGREYLSRNDGSFNITQFALGDDEIDYSLFNESHPNGTQYSAEAIENMPLIEAIPNGANIMNSKLITLNRGTSTVPFITTGGVTSITLLNNGQQSTPLIMSTNNLGAANAIGAEEYIFTILDSNLITGLNATGGSPGSNPTEADINEFSTISTSYSVRGKVLTLTAINGDGNLFSTVVTTKSTTLVIEGVTSGAIITIPVTVNRVS